MKKDAASRKDVMEKAEALHGSPKLGGIRFSALFVPMLAAFKGTYIFSEPVPGRDLTGVEAQPDAKGGIVLTACDGIKAIQVHDEKGHADMPIIFDLTKEMVEACRKPSPIILYDENCNACPFDLPEWAQPGQVSITFERDREGNQSEAFYFCAVFTKKRHPAYKKGECLTARALYLGNDSASLIDRKPIEKSDLKAFFRSDLPAEPGCCLPTSAVEALGSIPYDVRLTFSGHRAIAEFPDALHIKAAFAVCVAADHPEGFQCIKCQAKGFRPVSGKCPHCGSLDILSVHVKGKE